MDARTAHRQTPKDKAADGDEAFLASVREGLGRSPKRLSCKYFYDAEGSRLFDEICELPEYYLTRTEMALLRSLAPEFAKSVAPDSALVEFGAGSEMKAEILLQASPHIAAYVPIDISAEHLKQLAERVARKYRRLCVAPLAGDFTADLNLPEDIREHPLIGFFPGSTIGNYEPAEATKLLAACRRFLGPNARLLIGIDLVKETETLLRAYDDGKGVTAAFNKNILGHINRRLDSDIDLTAFDHKAVWNAERSRMEMYLVSARAQTVTIAGRKFAFEEGEMIHTENSHKYTVERFSALALEAGWAIERSWQSKDPSFAILLLK